MFVNDPLLLPSAAFAPALQGHAPPVRRTLLVFLPCILLVRRRFFVVINNVQRRKPLADYCLDLYEFSLYIYYIRRRYQSMSTCVSMWRRQQTFLRPSALSTRHSTVSSSTFSLVK